MREEEFRQWLLEKIEEMGEKIHQNSEGSCPFCCQDEYPVEYKEDGTFEEVENWDDADESHIDHTDDCFVTMLDEWYIKIRDKGLW